MRKIFCFFWILVIGLLFVSCDEDQALDDPAITVSTHTHFFGEWTVKTPATCTSEGYKESKCTCGLTNIEVIPLNEHIYGQWEEISSPTCTEQGTEARYCTCGATENRKTGPNGHSWGNWEITSPSTCTAEGNRTRTCSCGVEENSPIKKLSHSYGEWTVKTPATCTSEGYKESKCTCGLTNIEVIPLNEHIYGQWKEISSPTCTEQGTEARYCTCGATENRKTDPNGHSWGDWEVITPANCTEAGSQRRVCQKCTNTESAPTESVHPLDGGKIIVEPSCFQTGYIIYRCTVCKYFEQREIPQSHEFSEWEEEYPATCVAQGGIMRYCSKCQKTERDYIPPLGHDESDWTRVEELSNSVVYVERKGCSRCEVADDERKGFVKSTLTIVGTVQRLMNPFSPAHPNYNVFTPIERAAGSCYSDNGYYQAFLSDDGKSAVLVRLNVNTEHTVFSEVRTDLGFANDMTYNSKTNQLLVLNEKSVVIFDGDTLEYIRTVALPRAGDAIAYVESVNQYAIMVEDRVEYFNANFGFVRSFRIYNMGNGPYQICADDNYVYVLFVANDGINRNVHVYLHNGIALGKVAVGGVANANPTGISIVDGYLCISVPDGSPFTLLEKLG